MESPQPEHGQIIADEEAILEATLQAIRHYRGKRDQESGPTHLNSCRCKGC